jgi:hypothetical protein
MEQVFEALSGLLAAVLAAAVVALRPLVLAGVEVLRQRALATVQERIGEAAARKAVGIAMEVFDDPQVSAATREMVEAGAVSLRDAFADTAKRHGLPGEVFANILIGELARAGVKVER